MDLRGGGQGHRCHVNDPDSGLTLGTRSVGILQSTLRLGSTECGSWERGAFGVGVELLKGLTERYKRSPSIAVTL